MFLDSSLLRAFIDTFHGYGDYKAKYWFVGMEEGGGETVEEVARRISKWNDAGRPELLDLRGHHEGGDLADFVGGTEELQTTWSQLIRVALGCEGRPTDTEAVRSYQQFKLGRIGDETCLLELMPLPSPDAGKWYYRAWTFMSELRTRRRYMERYAPIRARRLRQLIEEHRPPVVVFYSLSYIETWKQVAGIVLAEVPIAGVKSFSGRNQHTVFVVIPQPAYWTKGKGNDYYIQVGRAIAASLAPRRSEDSA